MINGVDKAGIGIVLISGSLRAGSGSTAVLLTAQREAPPSVGAHLYHGMGALPHFNPDDDYDPVPEEVARLRALVAGADALLFSTPEYAGTLPGSFKNLLDWTVGGTEIVGKPAGWINPAAPGRAEGAHATLRTVLGYTGADLVEEACVRIPVGRADVDAETGAVADAAARAAIVATLRTLADHVTSRR